MQQRFIIEYGKSLHLNKWIALFYISCFIFGCSDTHILSPRFKKDPPPDISQSTIKKPPNRPPSPDIRPVSILIPGDVDSKYPMRPGVGFIEPSEEGTFAEEGEISVGRGLRGADLASLSGGNVTFAVPSNGRGLGHKGSSFLLGGEVAFAIPSSDRGFPGEGFISIGRSVRDTDTPSVLQGEEMKVAVLSEGRGFSGESLISVGRGLGNKTSSFFSDDKKVFLSGESVPFAVSSEQGELLGADFISIGRSVRDAGTSSVLQDEEIKVAVLSEGRGFFGEGLDSAGRGLGNKGSSSFSDDKKVSLSGESVSFAVSPEQGEFSKEDFVSVGRGLGYKGFPSLSGEVVQVAILSERQEFSEEGFISVGRSVGDADTSSVLQGKEMKVAVLSEEGGFSGEGLVSVGRGLGDQGSPSFSDDKKASLSGELVSFAVSSEEGEFPKEDFVSVGRGLGYKGFPSLSGEVAQVAILSEQQEFSGEDFISVGRSVRDEEGGAFPFGQSTPRESAFADENMAFSVSVEEGEQFITGETGTFTNGQWANEEQVSFEGSAVTFSIQFAETSFPEGKVVSFINYESVLKTVFFDVDSSELSQTTQKALDQNIRWMRNYPNVRVVLEGHCDPQGSEAYNIKLGQSRAEEVKQYLVEQGISEERLGLVSYGESNLLSYEDDAKNRRVSFLIDSEAQQEKE
ncbi:MAG: OmpA family protein [Bdellovibrionales bacterium]|nr:OmpA family protein [Bdellovibrionales bacterium]